MSEKTPFNLDYFSGFWRGYFKMQQAMWGYQAGDEWWFNVFMTFKNDGTFKGSGSDEIGVFQFKNGTVASN